jgi:CHRD domain
LNLQPVEEGGEAMKPCWIVVLVAVFAVAVGLGAPAVAAAAVPVEITLTPLQEPPICSSTGRGTFKGTLSDDRTELEYELTYELEGSATATQGHIHVAQPLVNGGISVWLCQSATNVDPTGLSPQCPASGTAVTGTLTSANVIGPTGQGIAAGEFAELVRAMALGATYANVHSALCPSGEIRGQIAR